MSYEHIKYETADRILTITLNRPEAMNAFTHTMMRELIDAFDRADADDDIRAIVITGAGDRAFCAGADLAAGGDTFDASKRTDREPDPDQRDGGGRVTLRMFDSKKPIIGAINGAAVGVGATMQLPMDIRLASSKARFGFVFTRRGIVPEACSSWFLPRVVGINQALEWVLSGRVFDAEEALKGGLIRSIHAPEDLLPEAYRIAAEIRDNTSGVSVALARNMMWKLLGGDHPMEAHKVDSRGIYQMGPSADCREGVEAFLEKRPAQFPMKPSSDMPDFYPWWSDRPFE